ncbi:uncharacterized protein LOC110102437 [Dendrobium catenatum]|uniref:uncharacterized protein LOC110102437 n=1 Tax=Dendrobium catenatum TaxID=906689 RepID=UPI0009F692D1|nr:uncharacterized protein LOC110102437 [Dendrobium catenatum]
MWREEGRDAYIIMGFKNVKEFYYLGIKMPLRRLRRDEFQFIIDKALNKLNQWSIKCLSLPGKIVLVKKVLLALATFHSTHALIPKKVLEDLGKISRDFISNKINGSKGLHYVSWFYMCKPIEYGGRELHPNISKTPALLARLAWRFIQDDQSLLHSVMASKEGDRLEKGNSRGYLSTTFKILSDGYKMLNPIVKWKIVNGSFVDAIKDNWILDKSINKWPTFVIPIDDSLVRVEEFILNGNWNEHELRKYFGRDLINLIIQIKISLEKKLDFLELINQKSGMKIPGLIRKSEAKGTVNDIMWNWIKKAKLNARVEVFWWRLKRNDIPSLQFLCYRRLIQNSNCPRGCDTIEDVEHILCGCCKLKEGLEHDKLDLFEEKEASFAGGTAPPPIPSPLASCPSYHHDEIIQ